MLGKVEAGWGEAATWEDWMTRLQNAWMMTWFFASWYLLGWRALSALLERRELDMKSSFDDLKGFFACAVQGQVDIYGLGE